MPRLHRGMSQLDNEKLTEEGGKDIFRQFHGSTACCRLSIGQGNKPDPLLAAFCFIKRRFPPQSA